METIAQILIYTHAVLGAVALISGLFALLSLKGSRRHLITGKVFYLSMIGSALIAIVISILPGHYNPFLLSIGILTNYLLIAGKRSLGFSKPGRSILPDKLLAYIMVFTGVTMAVLPLILSGSIQPVLLLFGIIGLAFGIRDIINFRKPNSLKKKWLTMHIGKMTGGYISAVTAFIVVNDVLPGSINWFLPTVIGSIYISWWINRIKTRKITLKEIFQKARQNRPSTIQNH